jgi:hypothetical protein
MKQMIAKTALLVSLIALGACTLAWGRSFEQVDATPDYVKYKYYVATVDEGGMNREALEYCATYMRNAVLDDREAVPGGATDEFVSTYQCVQPVAIAPEQLN